MISKLNPIAAIAKTDPRAAADAFTNLVNAWKDYKITAELEETKRENIRAWRDVNVKAIEKNTEILKHYLDSAFSERRQTIQGMFVLLDKGLASGDSQVINGALTSILEITRQSPLAGARELINSLEDPDVKQLEI